jgi:hypothetical protein
MAEVNLLDELARVEKVALEEFAGRTTFLDAGHTEPMALTP